MHRHRPSAVRTPSEADLRFARKASVQMLSPAQLTVLESTQTAKGLFASADKSGKGHLTKDEIFVVLSRTGTTPTDEIVDAIMAQLDTDGDGTVDYVEFLRGFKGLTNSIQAIHGEEPNPSPHEEPSSARSRRPSQMVLSASQVDGLEKTNKIKELFALCDTDGNGELDRSELVALMEGLAGGGTNVEAVVDHLFDILDTEHRGSINFVQFVRGMMSWDGMFQTMSTVSEAEPELVGSLPAPAAIETFEGAPIETFEGLSCTPRREDKDLDGSTTMLNDQLQMAAKILSSETQVNSKHVLQELAPILSDAQRTANDLASKLDMSEKEREQLQESMQDQQQGRKAVEWKLHELQNQLIENDIVNQEMHDRLKELETDKAEYLDKLQKSAPLKQENKKLLAEIEANRQEVENARMEEERLRKLNRQMHERQNEVASNLEDAQKELMQREESTWRLKEELRMLKAAKKTKDGLEKEMAQLALDKESLSKSLSEERRLRALSTMAASFKEEDELNQYPRDDPRLSFRKSISLSLCDELQSSLRAAEANHLPDDHLVDEFMNGIDEKTERLEKHLRTESEAQIGLAAMCLQLEDDLHSVNRSLGQSVEKRMTLQATQSELTAAMETLREELNNPNEGDGGESSEDEGIEDDSSRRDRAHTASNDSGPTDMFTFLDLASSLKGMFVGDSLGLAQDPKAMAMLKVHEGTDANILFSDHVVKINKTNWRQKRVWVITPSALYNLKMNPLTKRYSLKRRLALEDLEAISMSPLSVGLFCLHVPTQYDYIADSLRRTEIVCTLVEVCAQNHKKRLKLTFCNRFECKANDLTVREITVAKEKGNGRIAVRCSKVRKPELPAGPWKREEVTYKGMPETVDMSEL